MTDWRGIDEEAGAWDPGWAPCDEHAPCATCSGGGEACDRAEMEALLRRGVAQGMRMAVTGPLPGGKPLAPLSIHHLEWADMIERGEVDA